MTNFEETIKYCIEHKESNQKMLQVCNKCNYTFGQHFYGIRSCVICPEKGKDNYLCRPEEYWKAEQFEEDKELTKKLLIILRLFGVKHECL